MNPTAFATPAALSAQVFAPRTAICCRNNDLRTARPRRANVTMVSQTNIAKKQAKVQAAKDRLTSCQMIFSTALEGLTVSDVMEMKVKLPAGSSAAVVKNTLMRRAITDSEWEVAGDLVKQSSLWFFIEEDIKGTMKVYNEFAKEKKRDAIQGGVFEGMHQDTKGIEAIAALPSKKELLTKIAVSIKMVPTKLARSVNEVPTKVARAIKLAIADEEKDSSE